jgi:Fe-S-cluster-containing dehydrogenase component/DMSO reductase anchor subunit
MTLLSAVDSVDETPIDKYFQAQSDLTAVERFSQHHDADAPPAQARYYRDLIPLHTPQPGQQYAFEVDLDSCTGCKACVAACHSLNGLDDGESWRSVTLLTGGTAAAPAQQTVTAGCHHCLDPACLKGCPVDAYEKDPITGIVTHLDDQCIGCSYCTLSCPYEVPVYNKSRGIVRKCDMCQGRLAAGEAPACVQACPNGAISIAIVDTEAVAATVATSDLVPGAPPSSITGPTTVYRTAHSRVRDLAASGAARRGPATAHPSLAVMLVLTQLSVGAFVTDLLVRSLVDQGAGRTMQSFDAVLAAVAGVVALGASVLHLGRPRYCYRAVIGLRHSWLSREVVAFGAFTTLAVSYAAALWVEPAGLRRAVAALGVAVAASGIIGLGCSVMIYATTHRSSWRAGLITSKFAFTAAVCGLGSVIWASAVASVGVTRPLFSTLVALMALKLGTDAWHWRAQRALVLSPELRGTTVWRFVAGVIGGIVMPMLLADTSLVVGRSTWLITVGATIALVTIVVGELLERSLFFRTASAPT